MSSSPQPEVRPVQPDGTRWWRDPATWTLRARVLGVLLGLLAVVCLIIGLSTAIALDHFQHTQIDASLTMKAGEPPQNCPVNFRPGLPNGTVRRVAGDNAYVLRDNGCPAQVTAADALAALAAVPADGHVHTVDLGALGEFRAIVRKEPVRGPQDQGPGGGPNPADDSTADSGQPSDDAKVLILTAIPLRQSQHTLSLLIWTEVGVGGSALLIAALVGMAIVRRTLRPLDRVAATARRVAELPLSEGEVALAVRVPEVDTDPRTEVGQVGAALNRMLGHVGDALTARHASEIRLRRFIADASHELRTPLAAIRGYAELSRRTGAARTPEMAYTMDRVESAASRMTTLVEDLLLLARLDAGRPLDRKPVDLSVLVVEAVSDAHVAGPQHRWQLNLPEEALTVPGDSVRIHQVVANLLANARTHTPPGTTVTVSLEAHGGDALLQIGDNGPGIPPELFPHVFERFARADTSQYRTAGSTGLGLAIVQSVVAAHGGRVEVSSVPGQTTFAVRLPMAGPDSGNGGGPAQSGMFSADAQGAPTAPIADEPKLDA